ncbi:MAG: MMPL family transporter [Nitrospina sp.]|nr:MMPL family transporter [Nitrospina sp.]MBT3415056.1 MMPL family transporter [Nitrospina sp.]MBT3857958.1 MMPL family transporter [Nitrospina sp.]MBT4104712.1 MMPL family transporter [Nitrospina sp.]MBT4390400.1 MMPL family transporter [Nitrospina sp.]
MKTVLAWCFKKITSRYPGTLLVLAILLSGVSIYWASGLTFNPRMDNLLPQDLPLIKEFNEVVDKTGGSGPLVVVLEQLNPFQAPEVIGKLARALKKVPGTHFVDSKIPEEFLNNRQLLLVPRADLLRLESLVEEAVDYARGQFGGFFGEDELFNPIKLQTLADRYHIFEDINPYHRGKRKKNYYIFVKPKGTVTDTDFTEQYIRLVQEAIDHTGLEKDIPDLVINLTGSLVVRLEENQFIENDLKKSAVLAALLASCIILIYTRSWFSIPLIIFPLLLSLTYTFALTRLFIGHLNVISGFLVAILMGLGIDYGIHLYIRFKQELLKGKTIADAAELVVTQVGRSGLIAMLTTISVFSILSFSDFPGFSEFGKIATLGIICAFLSYYFIFPAQALFYDKIHWLRKPRPRLFTFKISNLYSTTPYFLSTLFLLLMVASLFLLPGISFEYDFQKLKGESPASEYETVATDDFGFAFSPTLILTPEKEDLFEIHTALEKIKRRSGDQTIIGTKYSLNMFSREEYESKKDVITRIRKLVYDNMDIIKFSLGNDRYENFKKLVNVEPFDEKQIPDNLKKKLRAEDDYLVLLLSPADKNFFRVENIYQLKKEVVELKRMMAEENIKVSVLNENLIAAEILDWVKEKGPTAMGIAFALVFLILVVDLCSIRLAVITFLPLFTGLALTGALMSVFNVKLNFINIVMLPSIVGIMIDHCIYLSHHILDYSKGASLKSLQETGSAIILSALTSLAGYTSLNIAHHDGIKSIATVVELGIITCTLCALFMLPALFELRKYDFPTRLKKYKGKKTK